MKCSLCNRVPKQWSGWDFRIGSDWRTIRNFVEFLGLEKKYLCEGCATSLGTDFRYMMMRVDLGGDLEHKNEMIDLGVVVCCLSILVSEIMHSARIAEKYGKYRNVWDTDLPNSP